ncbi:MAG: molecular chaperone TorD family protein [Desulfurococcales archaeon]|nr:molecular chaperone TorD family protein [Desulfurococcales archaeon]
MRECITLTTKIAAIIERLLLNPKHAKESWKGLDASSDCPAAQCREALLLAVQAFEKLRAEPSDELEIDYTRLFTASYPRPKCPVYESHYSGGERTLGKPDIIDDLYSIIREAGLMLDTTRERLPDNILVILELYSIISSNPHADTQPILRKLAYNHLTKTLPRLAKCIEENTETGYYRLVSKALARYAECLREIL